MFDTLEDPVYLLMSSVRQLLYGKRDRFGTRGYSLIQGLMRQLEVKPNLEIVGYWLTSNQSVGSRELMEKKYNHLRRDIISLLVQLLADLY